MADPNAFYEPEEDELLSSMAVPTYDNDYDDEYRRLQELEAHAFAQQAQQDQLAQLEMVPEDVKRVSPPTFLRLSHNARRKVELVLIL